MIDLEGKDGTERDIAKLRNRLGPWRQAMKPHFKRFFKRPTPHTFTNLCTESSRADAYLNGHIMAISTGLIILISIVVAMV